MALGYTLSSRLPVLGRKTAAAGTKIKYLIPPKRGFRTVIEKIVVTTGGTAHTLTVMRPIGSTTTTAAAAAAQAIFSLAADPGISRLGPNGTTSRLADNALNANDHLAFELPDGTFTFDIVNGVPGSYPGNVTMTANFPTNGVASGAQVWNFGVEADTDPKDGEARAHQVLTLTASVTNTFTSTEGGVITTHGFYEPILLIIDNATAASVLEYVVGGYSKF